MSEPAPQGSGKGILLSDDLMFTSRITATARALGVTVQTARSVEALDQLLQQQPRCLLVDLGHPGLDIAALVAQVRERCSLVPNIVAYGSHVDTATLRQAREAGCNVVLPRSKFVEELPTALAAWMACETGN
jgi:CheY-like chemotaxis protein